jgi:hypothetical protein
MSTVLVVHTWLVLYSAHNLQSHRKKLTTSCTHALNYIYFKLLHALTLEFGVIHFGMGLGEFCYV